MAKKSASNAGKDTGSELTAEQKAEQEAVKAAKFEELATKRMTQLLNRFNAVTNLANRQNYVYTDEQASKIIATVNEAANKLRKAFTEGGTQSAGFTF